MKFSTPFLLAAAAIVSVASTSTTLFVNAKEDVAETFRGVVSTERRQRRSLSTREQRRGLMGMGTMNGLPSFKLGSQGKSGKGDSLFCETKFDPFKAGSTEAECIATYGFDTAAICDPDFKMDYVSFTDYCAEFLSNPTWCTTLIDGEKCGECLAIYGEDPACLCVCGLDALGNEAVATSLPACGPCGVCCALTECTNTAIPFACATDCNVLPATTVNPCLPFCPP
jgi:hypothetical protein